MIRRIRTCAGPAYVRRLVSSPGGFAVVTCVYVLTALALDRGADRVGEAAIGVATWGALLFACRSLEPLDRARVAALVLVATAGEVVGSLILGWYTYRRADLPAFVPPGHGLVYLTGLRLSRSAFVRRRARAVAVAALTVGAAWALAGVTITTRSDALPARCAWACSLS